MKIIRLDDLVALQERGALFAVDDLHRALDERTTAAHVPAGHAVLPSPREKTAVDARTSNQAPGQRRPYGVYDSAWFVLSLPSWGRYSWP